MLITPLKWIKPKSAPRITYTFIPGNAAKGINERRPHRPAILWSGNDTHIQGKTSAAQPLPDNIGTGPNNTYIRRFQIGYTGFFIHTQVKKPLQVFKREPQGKSFKRHTECDTNFGQTECFTIQFHVQICLFSISIKKKLKETDG